MCSTSRPRTWTRRRSTPSTWRSASLCGRELTASCSSSTTSTRPSRSRRASSSSTPTGGSSSTARPARSSGRTSSGSASSACGSPWRTRPRRSCPVQAGISALPPCRCSGASSRSAFSTCIRLRSRRPLESASQRQLR
ncbi:hypothetical protein ACFPRL_22130 [Pseudoclavibacter helvolus]